jgi:Flp pilus assembly protein TadG
MSMIYTGSRNIIWRQEVIGVSVKAFSLFRSFLGLRGRRPLWRDRRGNFAVLFALSMPVIMIFLGMGVDFLTALSFKSRWDTAADAAAIASVEIAQNYVKANSSTQSTSVLNSNASAAGIAGGLKAFAANAGASVTTETVTPSVTVTMSGMSFTAVTSYTGTITSNFGGFVGVAKLSVSGSASANSSIMTYINYYFIVDISQSMGLGSTAADMQNLYNRTAQYGNSSSSDHEPGCVFGCHVSAANPAGTAPQTYSNEFLAHSISPYITLRIDAAKTAIQEVLSTAQAQVGTAQNVQFAIYTMSKDPTTGVLLNPVAGLSSNFSSLSAAASAIDLGGNVEGGDGDTDYSDQLGQFENHVLSLASAGNGASPSAPLNFVFIITDGVQDYDTGSASCYYGHCVQALDSSLCTPLKAKATVGVIYTTYLPVYQNNNSADGYDGDYSTLVLPIASQIAPALQSCATSASYFYQADDGPALENAMNHLFASTFQNLALTR